MYAALVFHKTRPALLEGDTAALDAADDAWIGFAARQPGFVEFIVLARPEDDRVVAVSIWESEAAFRAVLANPEAGRLRAGYAGMFEQVTPEFFAVRSHRKA